MVASIVFGIIDTVSAGDSLAIALGKVLQANRKLKHVVWEDNCVNAIGWRKFIGGLERNGTLLSSTIPNTPWLQRPEELSQMNAKIVRLLSQNSLTEGKRLAEENARKATVEMWKTTNTDGFISEMEKAILESEKKLSELNVRWSSRGVLSDTPLQQSEDAATPEEEEEEGSGSGEYWM